MTGFLPFGRGFALAARARFGRVFPFGNTVPGGSTPGILQSAQLRTVLLTAGGTGSVRGWGNGMVGPKFPNLTVPDRVVDSVAVLTDSYIPSGGLARASGSAEVRMPPSRTRRQVGYAPLLRRRKGVEPRPPLPRTATSSTSNAGSSARARGLDLATPIGPIRVSVGYKLNPSPLDVRDARDVFDAIRNDRPLSTVPTDWTRRLHLHISLGAGF